MGIAGRLRQLLTKERLRFLKFCVVGGSGVVVNELVLIFGVEVLFSGLEPSVRLSWSAVLAIGVAILTNFLLNDAWTWRDRTRRPSSDGFLTRLLRYYLVAAVAGVVQWSVLKLMTESADLDYRLSNLVGIAAGLVINFFVNNVWTFRVARPPEDR